MDINYMPNCRTKGQRGFTLVELLVVLMLLVVSGVLIYNETQQTARDKVDEANVKILNSATLQWMLEDESNDPRSETTDSLKGKIENRLIVGWPVSPNGKDYVLDNGQWKAE